MSIEPSKLTFHGGWEYAPAPESTDHVSIEEQYALFIGGEFVGGGDIVRNMFEAGALQPLVDKALPAKSE